MAPDSTEQSCSEIGMVPHVFSVENMDTSFNFQIIPLESQVYLWVGCNGARMGELFAAVPTRFDAVPSVSALIGGSTDSSGAGMARRLAMKLKRSVLLASSVPPNSPILEAFAEKRLLQELRTLNLIPTQGAPLGNGVSIEGLKLTEPPPL